MKRSAVQVTCVVTAAVTLLQSTSSDGHITLPTHFGGAAGIPPHLTLSSSHSHLRPQIPTIPLPDVVSPNLLLATTFVAIMTFLADNPKILCITPPFLVADLLGRLSDPALTGAVPHELVYRFVSSVHAVPSLSNAIPSDVYASLIQTLSAPAAPGNVVASSDTTVAATPNGGGGGAYPGSPSPGVAEDGQKTLTGTPAGSAPSVPAAASPGIVASSQKTLDVTPAGSAPSVPAAALPGIVASSQKTLDVTPAGSAPSVPATALPGIVASSQKTLDVTPAGSAPSVPATALPGIVASSQKTLDVTPAGSALPGVAATSQTAVGVLPAGGGNGGAYPGPAAPPSNVAATSEAAASVVPAATGPSSLPAGPTAPYAVPAIAPTPLAQGGSGMNVALLISLLQKGVSSGTSPLGGLAGGAHKGCSAPAKKPINPFKTNVGQSNVFVQSSKRPTIALPPLPPPPPPVEPQSPDKFGRGKIHQIFSNCFTKPTSAGKTKPTSNHPLLPPVAAPCPTNVITR